MVIELSAPLLFSFESIDRYAEYNSKYKKSKITMLFNSIPWPQSEKYNEWIMSHRMGTSNPDIQTYEDFDKYAQYAMSKGFKVVYLMNSPKAFNDIDIGHLMPDFHALLDNLWHSGIRNIKFSNTQVAQLINDYNPNFQLSVGTVMEYDSIPQYEALFRYFPNINNVCIPKNLNQNFHMLKALKEKFPNIDFELMVGEGCPKWCPSRMSCQASSYSDYYKIGCKLARQNLLKSTIMNGAIHPWQLDKYRELGFNQFKLLTHGARATDIDTSNIELYMKNIEYGTIDEHGRKYLSIYCGKLAYLLPVEECINLLPNINHFIKNGYKCTIDCGVNCTYCNECVKKIEERLNDCIN